MGQCIESPKGLFEQLKDQSRGFGVWDFGVWGLRVGVRGSGVCFWVEGFEVKGFKCLGIGEL